MQKICIGKNRSCGMTWFESENTLVRGYAFVDGECLEGPGFVRLFSGVNSKERFRTMLAGLNGIFSVIIDCGDLVLAAVDRYGTFKLYYHHENESMLIGDDAGAVIKDGGLHAINKDGIRDWCYAGFVSGDETLVRGLKTLNASEYLVYDKKGGGLFKGRYHHFSRIPVAGTFDFQNKRLGKVSVNVRDRFISSLKGKKVLIPLSGGVDSRFGALLLKQAGYENVLCFTYGSPGGDEEKRAVEAAEAYGFDHLFIPYERKKWRNLFKDEENLGYIRYAANYKATPHFTDLFAARHLAGLFNPADCLVVPGHVGSIAESMFESEGRFSGEDVIENLIVKYFYYYGFRSRKINEFLLERLSGYAPGDLDLSAAEAQGAYDDAAYDTYRSNHLMMALRPYEYYGFGWRLPLMDNELVDFFKSVPLEYLGKNKKLLSYMVTKSIDNDPGLHRMPDTYFEKVIRNIKDRRYSCIHPYDVFKLMKKEFGLPGIHRVIYRYYRNFLSYTAARTLQIMLDKEIK